MNQAGNGKRHDELIKANGRYSYYIHQAIIKYLRAWIVKRNLSKIYERSLALGLSEQAAVETYV